MQLLFSAQNEDHVPKQSGENSEVQKKGLRCSLLQDNAHEKIMKKNRKRQCLPHSLISF